PRRAAFFSRCRHSGRARRNHPGDRVAIAVPCRVSTLYAPLRHEGVPMAIPLLPSEPHDARLRANAHPADWTPPTPAPRYNLVVIGAGTAGLVSAAGAAGLGAKVALVERDLMGGDCLNVGCVPSKALIRSARAAAAVRGAGRFGV